MPTIDGDAHVMEGPQTWEYCDPTERKFVPVLLNPGPEADRQFWLIDGKIRGHVRFLGSALAQVGKTIELAGLGDRFNGAVLIGGVHHGIRGTHWTSIFR